MKTCERCGGMLYRKGAAAKGGERFQCRDCRKTITVRDGRIVTGNGPRVRDWRTEGQADARNHPPDLHARTNECAAERHAKSCSALGAKSFAA